MKLSKKRIKTQMTMSNRRGATAVEFAMTAPIAFLLLFGALELGHANKVYHSAEAAAYEGARKGIVPGATAAECISDDMLRLCRVRGATVTVTPNNLTPADPSVTVRVEVPYRNNSIVVPFFTRNLVINRECKLSRERGN
jgi:hypothetical protein